MQTLTKLDQMDAKARDLAGPSADWAIDLYLSGDLLFQEYHHGADVWTVRGLDHEPYTVSFRDKVCTCPDRNATRHPTLGKLCKHRVAVMYAIRLRDDGLAELVAMLDGATGATLRLTVNYGQPQQYWLEAIRIHGQREIVLSHAAQMDDNWHRFQFDPTDLDAALAKVGWGVDANTKQRGVTHTWTLAPGVDSETSLLVMRSMAGNSRANIEQRARLATLETAETVLAGLPSGLRETISMEDSHNAYQTLTA